MELTHFSYLSEGWTSGSFYCRGKFWRRMVPVKRKCQSVTWVCHTEHVQGCEHGFASYLNCSPEQKEMVNLEGRACPWDGSSVQSVQSLSRVRLFATPWTAALPASLSITNSQSLLRLTSIELVMPSNHLILCPLLLLPPSTFLSLRDFSDESVLHIRWPKYWSFSFSNSQW